MPEIDKIATDNYLDGIVSAFLLMKMHGIDDPARVFFIDKKEIDNHSIRWPPGLGPLDLPTTAVADLPYIQSDGYRCAVWFDHHEKNIRAAAGYADAPGLRDGSAQSCAGLIARYMMTSDPPYKLGNYGILLRETDRIDHGEFTLGDLVMPEGYMLLSTLVYKGYTHNGDLSFKRHVLDLMLGYDRRFQKGDVSLTGKDIVDFILEDSVVSERVDAYKAKREAVIAQVRDYIGSHTRMAGDIPVLDMTECPEELYDETKYWEYAIFPECQLSVRVSYEDGLFRMKIAKNLFIRGTGREYNGDVCDAISGFNGGGHSAACGMTCPVSQAQDAFSTVMGRLQPVADDSIYRLSAFLKSA